MGTGIFRNGIELERDLGWSRSSRPSRNPFLEDDIARTRGYIAQRVANNELKVTNRVDVPGVGIAYATRRLPAADMVQPDAAPAPNADPGAGERAAEAHIAFEDHKNAVEVNMQKAGMNSSSPNSTSRFDVDFQRTRAANMALPLAERKKASGLVDQLVAQDRAQKNQDLVIKLKEIGQSGALADAQARIDQEKIRGEWENKNMQTRTAADQTIAGGKNATDIATTERTAKATENSAAITGASNERSATISGNATVAAATVKSNPNDPLHRPDLPAQTHYNAKTGELYVPRAGGKFMVVPRSAQMLVNPDEFPAWPGPQQAASGSPAPAAGAAAAKPKLSIAQRDALLKRFGGDKKAAMETAVDLGFDINI